MIYETGDFIAIVAVPLGGAIGWLILGNQIATRYLGARDLRRHRPRIRISVPQAESIFTRVWLEGTELRYVKRVRFDTGHDIGEDTAVVTTEIVAEVELEGDAGLESNTRRRANPSSSRCRASGPLRSRRRGL